MHLPTTKEVLQKRSTEADGDAQDELEDEDEAMESASDGMSGPSLVMSDVSAKRLRISSAKLYLACTAVPKIRLYLGSY